MYWYAKLGCFFLLYGPYCIIGTAALRRKPQLFIVWLLALLWAYGTYWLTSLLYYSIRMPNESSSSYSFRQPPTALTPRQWSPWCSGQPAFAASSSSSSSSDGVVSRVVVLWLFHQLFQFVMKTVLLILLLRINSFLRDDQQLLVSSRFRFIPVGCTVGLGYGAAAMLVSAAPALLSSESTLVGTTRASPSLAAVAKTVTAYDLHICPQMPALVYFTLQSLLYSVANLFWGTIHGICVAALFHMGAERVTKSISRASLSQFFFPTHVDEFAEHTASPREFQPLGLATGDDTDAWSSPVKSHDTATATTTATWIPASTRRAFAREEAEAEAAAGYEEHPSSGAGAISMPIQWAPATEWEVTKDVGRQGKREMEGEEVEWDDEENMCCLAESSRCASETSIGPTSEPPNEVLAPNEILSPAKGGLTSQHGKSPRVMDRSPPIAIPLDSSVFLVSHNPVFLLIVLGLVFILQLLFTGLTLRLQSGEDRGAYSCSQRLVLTNRGCVFSLPLQLVISTISMLGALRMTQMEFNRR